MECVSCQSLNIQIPVCLSSQMSLCVCLELCLGFLISPALVCGCFSRWMPVCTQGVSGKVTLHLCVSVVDLLICSFAGLSKGRVWQHACGLEWVEQVGCAQPLLWLELFQARLKIARLPLPSETQSCLGPALHPDSSSWAWVASHDVGHRL